MTTKQRMITLIKNHFVQPLSLKTVASEIGINPSHLGYLFKEETGQDFSDYLKNIHIHAAEKITCSFG